MKYHIRYAKLDDVDVLGKIHSKSLIEAFKGVVPDDVLYNYFSLESRTDCFQRELREGTPQTALCFYENEPVGFVSYGDSRCGVLDNTSIEIWRIYLLPDYWNKGIGTQLMDWCILELKNKGYKNVVLWVLEDNNRAIQFYDKYGFMHDGEIKITNLGKELKEIRFFKRI